MNYSDYIRKYSKNSKDIKIYPGYPLISGTNYINGGLNINVTSKYGKNVYIMIYKTGSEKPSYEIKFPEDFRYGNTFSMYIRGIDWKKYEYTLRVSGEYDPKKGLLFDENNELLDPYANKISGMDNWGEERKYLRSGVIVRERNKNRIIKSCVPLDEMVIYEMHVKGFTSGDGENCAPGTFQGMEEKIPYLKKLGVNCVEFMPIFEFDEMQNTLVNPFNNDRLKNYWGYQPISFYAPKSGYAKGDVISELKHLIDELHRNSIECWLDVVFNHTGEMGDDGPAVSFRGLDNSVYYMLDEEGQPYNFTGCGNTFNCNNAAVRDFIIDSLRYWRCEYDIDGFRFDLASVMTRDEKGTVLQNPPLIDQISNDPVLAGCRFVAEPWDAGGLYQLGVFYKYPNWLEWNGKYRDTLRGFMRGDNNTVADVKNRVSGSLDIYGNNLSSVNFICCHDGFTLNDLFSYNEKHNEANGENNRDGNDWNLSFNCGCEGETDNKEILALRDKMVKNALIILFMSKGIPMILMGDECRRTQKGNNNAYCQDNEISWFDWSLPEKNRDLEKLVSDLTFFRKKHKNLFSLDSRTEFHGIKLNSPDYSETSHTLAFVLADNKEEIYVGMNMYTEKLSFELPEGEWDTVFSSGNNTVKDNYTEIDRKSVAVLIKSV